MDLVPLPPLSPCFSQVAGDSFDYDKRNHLFADLDKSRPLSSRRRQGAWARHLSGKISDDSDDIGPRATQRHSSLGRTPHPNTAYPALGSLAVVSYAGASRSPFKSLPTEVFQLIAALVPDDDDLKALILTCRQFARALEPENSSVWRSRFLARYDYPNITHPRDFRVAYQLRQFVLRHFEDSVEQRTDEVWDIQLNVLRDMIVEAYNPQSAYSKAPKQSRNLGACAALDTSPWMVALLSAPTFQHNTPNYPYGRANRLFDAIQLVFTYLLLNRRDGRVARYINTSRTYYNLELVYNWNRPCRTLLTRLPDEPSTSPTFQSVLFPNLTSPTPEPPPPKYELNLHELLHIRNFWHRHLVEGSPGFSGEIEVENTYVTMMSKLRKLGRTPTAWEKAVEDTVLQDGVHEWLGHYSCLHPWPKKRTALEEAQTCAENWDTIDPLTLNFTATSSNESGIWPPIFRRTAVLKDIVNMHNLHPKLRFHPDHKTYYIRGLAPFLDLAHAPKSPDETQPKYHTFTSLRLRGVVHTLADQARIPGWQHIVMVLYQPSLVYLLSVLGDATENYGSAFTQIQPGQVTTTAGMVDAALGLPAGIDPDEAEKHYKALLDAYLADIKGPVSMSRQLVETMEDRFVGGDEDGIAMAPGRLSWEDIEYAYAYEGVIIPGGKVMMGRWWRCGEGEDEVGNVGPGGVETWLPDRERGPWLFWR